MLKKGAPLKKEQNSSESKVADIKITFKSFLDTIIDARGIHQQQSHELLLSSCSLLRTTPVVQKNEFRIF
jgi:hypothetical protein